MLTRLTFLFLLLLGSGCSSLVGSNQTYGSRTQLVLSEAERPLWPVLMIAAGGGVAKLALHGDEVLITDDTGEEFLIAVEVTRLGVLVEGCRQYFRPGRRFVVGRGGRFMLLEDRDYVAWAKGRPGWWDRPEQWTNGFQAQRVTRVKS